MEKEGEDARAARPPAQSYAFEGKVIRLTQKDFDQWRKVYHAIPDLLAELNALDVWASNQSEAKQKAWFQSVSGSLNRKHQELLVQKADVPNGQMSFEEQSRKALYKLAAGYQQNR